MGMRALMAEQPPPAVSTRKRIGPFSITAVLGEGGMGTVYRAKRKGEEAAVKIIRPSLLDKADIRQRFEREAELLQSVDNPHVAKIIGFDASTKTAPWLATEFIDGPTLKDWTAQHSAIEEKEWITIAEGVLSGLSAIHEKGIIHRDIKPANIMMSPEGPKIIDFGISKEEGQTAFTQTQMFAGTVAYLAPERAEGQDETQASDVYSAGLALAYAAKGEHPWGDETSQSELSLLMKMATEPPNLSELGANQKKLLLSLLEKDPARRPTALHALEILRGTREPNAPVKLVREKPLDKGFRLPRVRRADFHTGLVATGTRGLLLGLMPFALVFFTSVLTATPAAESRVSESAQIAAWLASDALRFSPTFVPIEWLVDGNFVAATQIALRPATLTALLVLIMVLWGRKYSSVLAQMDTPRRAQTIAALLVPTVLPSIALSWIFVGTVSLGRAPIDIRGMMPWDGLFGLALVSLGFLTGLISGEAAHPRSVARWWLLAARRFVTLLVVALAAISVGAAAYVLISPDFSIATSTPNGGPFFDSAFGEYARLALWVVALLPALFVFFASAALTGQAQFGFRTDQRMYFELLAGEPGAGIVSNLLPGDWLFASGFLVLLVIIALISGAYAANRAETMPHTAKQLIQIGLLTAGATIVGFISLRAGVAPSSDVRGTWWAHSDWTHALAAGGLVTAFALVFAAVVVIAGLPLVRTRVNAVFTRIAGRTDTALVSRSGKKLIPWPQLGGVAVIASVAIVTLVVPSVFGGIERAWAVQNTPADAVADLAYALEIQDADGLKDALGGADAGPWLPDGALEAAQPMLGGNRSVSVKNDLGQEWSLGEMGAAANVRWSEQAEAISWDVNVSSEIERRVGYIRLATHTVEAEPVLLRLIADTDLVNVPDAQIVVNGEAVKPGEYSAVPGTYEITRDGVLLLAPFTHSVTTSTPVEEVEIPNILTLPAGAENMLDTALDARSDSCGSIFSPNCYDRDEIDRFEERISGSVPSNYYDLSRSGKQDAGIKCWEPDDRLLSPSEMERTVKCEQSVTSQTVYYDSRTIAEPVYSRRCARYSYSFWFGFYCSRYETYQSGTNYRTVRGGELATVKYRSEVPFNVSVVGALNDEGQFEVAEATVQ